MWHYYFSNISEFPFELRVVGAMIVNLQIQNFNKLFENITRFIEIIIVSGIIVTNDV